VAQLAPPTLTSVEHVPQARPVQRPAEVRDQVLASVGPPLMLPCIARVILPDTLQPVPPGPVAPSWISPAAWVSVPPTRRVALMGARLEGGGARSPRVRASAGSGASAQRGTTPAAGAAVASAVAVVCRSGPERGRSGLE
jgi:hypothetical protein